MELKGYKYPLALENGTLALVESVDYVQSQVLSILQTILGERMGKREIGVDLELFRSITQTDTIALQIERALISKIPLQAVQVTVEATDNGELVITVGWVYNEVSEETIQTIALN